MHLLRNAPCSRLMLQQLKNKLTMLKRWREHLNQAWATFTILMLQLYDMAKATEDHKERLVKADHIKADIAKTLDAVFDANNVLQV